MEVDVHLSLGSNLKDRDKNLLDGIELLREFSSIESISPIYETPPLGFESENQFLNLCVHLKTELSPQKFLNFIHEIEAKMGRVRSDEGYISRTLDIDIILIGDIVLKEDNIEIPHPRFRERRFVLRPLTDIAADAIDPLSGKSVETLLQKCPDESAIIRHKNGIWPD